MSESPEEVTALLHQANNGDSRAGSRLFRIVHDQLHRMADKKLANEPVGTSMQATVLVHDAYLQLMGGSNRPEMNDSNHFYVLAAKAMRRILIDRARKRKAQKRGGPHWKKANLPTDSLPGKSAESEILDLHHALKRLQEIDHRQSEIVELRYFGGYSVEETAKYLEVSVSTVKQDFAAAKAWLFRELNRT